MFVGFLEKRNGVVWIMWFEGKTLSDQFLCVL